MLDGLTGTGKSTTASYLALQYQTLGIPYRYYWELEIPHPVNMRTGFGETVFTPAERMELGLAKWKAFVEHAERQERITVFDGKPFHIVLFYMILHDNASQQQVVDYFTTVAHVTSPLKPRLIYLRRDDIRTAIRELGEVRGDDWVEGLTKQIEERSNGNFKGSAGLTRFFNHYRTLLEAALGTMDMDALTIDTTSNNWTAYYDTIRGFLSMGDCALPPDRKQQSHLPDDRCPARLEVKNRTAHSIIAYLLPRGERFSQYAFELAPRDIRIYETTIGSRFRIHDVNDGGIIQDVIACESEQTVNIDVLSRSDSALTDSAIG